MERWREREREAREKRQKDVKEVGRVKINENTCRV